MGRAMEKLEALLALGPSPIHRKTFMKKIGCIK